MGKYNFKVICMILAVFLLLIGAPFLSSWALDETGVVDIYINKMTWMSDDTLKEPPAILMDEKADAGLQGSSIAYMGLSKAFINHKSEAPYLLCFLLAGFGLMLMWMASRFYPWGRYSSYNYVKYFLLELRIIHRADGKCRCGSM